MEARHSLDTMLSSLYVHVPFCAKKCEYCAFYSERVGKERMERYVLALIQEIRAQTSCPSQPQTVFFGGGTPSLLPLSQWERIFDALAAAGWQSVGEFTVECNPATVSADKARLFRDGGVNRISLGVQSLDDALLDRLGRVHSKDMVFRSYEILRKAGFDNVNLDLMFALPGQTLEIWESTLAEALEMKSEHLSCYEVIYEEDTPLFQQLQTGEIVVDEDLADDMYQLLLDLAAENGFEQYEIANFAKSSSSSQLPRRACRHNINYWTGGEYLGLGPAAASHVHGCRYQNWPDLQQYCAAVESGKPPRDPGGERLDPLAKAAETAAFWLRMNRGIHFDAFQQRTGFDFEENWAKEQQALIAKGWGERRGNCFRLTRQGLRFADAAGAELLRLLAETQQHRPASHSSRAIKADESPPKKRSLAQFGISKRHADNECASVEWRGGGQLC